MGTGLSRAQVIEVIQRAAGTLRTQRSQPEDSAAISAALAGACKELGVSPTLFDGVIATDADLEQLKKMAITEALAGSTDPGPNDAISREASTGQPGDHAQGPGVPKLV